MEKRPDEQRWVDKARAELEALEAMQPQPSGRIEEKDAGDELTARANQKLQRELGRSERAGSIIEDHDDLMNPFDGDDGRLARSARSVSSRAGAADRVQESVHAAARADDRRAQDAARVSARDRGLSPRALAPGRGRVGELRARRRVRAGRRRAAAQRIWNAVAARATRASKRRARASSASAQLAPA